ncbi:hypothetical protein C7413_1445 [Paraburkholderia silvatlantica]|nr:hypothetical protein C7411_1415 [Paraburkholderia silvatlantica]PXW24552.1 hypothetical protein C7413_1445 [Paraburkholderia silvatlantica]
MCDGSGIAKPAAQATEDACTWRWLDRCASAHNTANGAPAMRKDLMNTREKPDSVGSQTTEGLPEATGPRGCYACAPASPTDSCGTIQLSITACASSSPTRLSAEKSWALSFPS